MGLAHMGKAATPYVIVWTATLHETPRQGDEIPQQDDLIVFRLLLLQSAD